MRRSSPLLVVLGLIPAAALFALDSGADEIRLRTGRTISDIEIVEETYESVNYKIHGSPQAEPAANVAHVVYDRRPVGWDDAEKAFKQGEFARLTKDFEDYSRARESWVRTYALFYLGECRRLSGDLAGAVETYNKLLQDFPKTRFYAQARIGLGLIKVEQKDFAGAEKAFGELVQEAKAKKLGDDVQDESAFRLGTLLEAQGKLREAAERYERLATSALIRGSGAAVRAAIAAERLRAQNDPSKCDMALRGLEGRLREIDERKAPDPGDHEVLAALWNAFGDVHSAKGDHAQALLAYLRVVVDPDLGKVASERAKALYGAAVAFEKTKSQDWKERAESLRRELRERYPQSPWARK